MARVAALVPLILAFALCASVSAAPAATFTFTAAADTYVNQAYPRKSYGGANRVWSQGTPNPVNEAYVRFDVSGISVNSPEDKLRVCWEDSTGNGPALSATSAG